MILWGFVIRNTFAIFPLMQLNPWCLIGELKTNRKYSGSMDLLLDDRVCV